ncbi:MAG: beta-lactamase family protein, partial [Firmicutes bacterium]|nr:beta-lactamase family protein [Bacillota bacterium]
MTCDELFNIYSCSKVTTVTAGMQLLERGRFLLTDPLYEYIPEFRHMHVRTASGHVVPAQNPITIGQLFT